MGGDQPRGRFLLAVLVLAEEKENAAAATCGEELALIGTPR